MGNIWEHMVNGTPTASWHELDWWRSPRWTVIRIQALAMVAIIISFFLAAFGSCRRWSNRWIVQKGFFTAHALSLSLGAYSIGLMQSSSVKSEMYPIWTVSLFTLFGCIDPVTTYNSLDYKGPLSKVVFGICLNFGYVLLISISIVSGVFGKTAITVLSVITFIKGFHRSLALVHQSRTRNRLQTAEDFQRYTFDKLEHISQNQPANQQFFNLTTNQHQRHQQPQKSSAKQRNVLLKRAFQGWRARVEDQVPFKDVNAAFYMCRTLQWHFFGLGNGKQDLEALVVKGVNCKWAMDVIEVELAFLYDSLFTGNEFLYCFQEEAASLWALASFIGICFMGVAAAIIPRTVASRGSTQVVDTTTADLVVTFVILLSLALLQLMQLVRRWTSNWARFSINRHMPRRRHPRARPSGGLALFQFTEKVEQNWSKMWMSLRMFVATRMNWFDKQLWQDKIGQYSVLPDMRYGISTTWMRRGRWTRKCHYGTFGRIIRRIYMVLGLDYVSEVLWDLLGGDTHKSSDVRLGGEVKVKESIIEFLGQMRSDRLDGDWWFSFPGSHHPSIERYLPYSNDPHFKSAQHGYRYTSCVMMWHTATWYLEQAFIKKEKKEQAGGRGENEEISRNRRVAIALSNYCTYLVASAPDLLPGPAPEVSRAYNDFMKSARVALVDSSVQQGLLAAMSNPETLTKLVSDGMENWESKFSSAKELLWPGRIFVVADPLFWDGVGLANHLLLGGCDVDHWKTLSLVWVRLLLYAAPYGNTEAHVQHLAQGGEFITHLWALLYHLNILEWKLPETVPNITTMEHAQSILRNEGQDIVVAFLDSLSGNDNEELANVSKLECGVKFYQTSNPDVANFLHVDAAVKRPVLVLLRNNGEENILYDGEFRALAIAHFLYANRIPLANQGPAHRARTTEEINGWAYLSSFIQQN